MAVNTIDKLHFLSFIIVNISPICPIAPHGRISTKFCTAVEVVDLITCDKFFRDRLRYVDFVGVKIYWFPGLPID